VCVCESALVRVEVVVTAGRGIGGWPPLYREGKTIRTFIEYNIIYRRLFVGTARGRPAVESPP